MSAGSTGVDGCSGHTWQQTTWPQHWQPLQVWLGSLCLVQSRVEWSGVEWSGVEWSGVEWSVVEWSGVEWSGIIQRPVCVHLWPQTIVRPQYMMEHPILVKVMVQPALHIATMDRRECNARPGMMWAFLAAAGSSGRSRVQVCVDCTLSPFGRWATRGTVAVQMFVAGVLVVRNGSLCPSQGLPVA
jgi:hypothetical protein